MIQYRCSSTEPEMHGVAGWVILFLEDEDTAWDPRQMEEEGEIEGPCRVRYHQYINGTITCASISAL